MYPREPFRSILNGLFMTTSRGLSTAVGDFSFFFLSQPFNRILALQIV